MTRKRLINFKTVFGAVIVVLLIAVVATLIIMNSGEPRYNDDYFVSDGSKIVEKFEPESLEGDVDKPSAIAAYTVYYYSGETINNVKVFYKYEKEEYAKEAYDSVKEEEIEWASEKKLNHEYVIFEMKQHEYEELTTELVRNIVE